MRGFRRDEQSMSVASPTGRLSFKTPPLNRCNSPSILSHSKLWHYNNDLAPNNAVFYSPNIDLLLIFGSARSTIHEEITELSKMGDRFCKCIKILICKTFTGKYSPQEQVKNMKHYAALLKVITHLLFDTTALEELWPLALIRVSIPNSILVILTFY